MSKFLDDFAKFITDNEGRVFSIAEIRGESLPEKINIKENNPCQNIYSVSKVFTVTAIGILCDRGLITTDNTVTELLGDECPAGFDKYWEQTTLDMLMRHRVGFPGGFDIDVFDASKYNPDYLTEIMLKKWVCPPDTERRYDDAGYYILSRIVKKVSGKPLFAFCWENIFEPLRFREAAWSCCPKGHAMGGTGLYIRVEDMVKIGGVYLNKGEYLGKRIVSEEWVNKTLERSYELSPDGTNGAYSKGGMNGQKLIIIPSENRAIGWQGYDIHPDGPDLTGFVREYKI